MHCNASRSHTFHEVLMRFMKNTGVKYRSAYTHVFLKNEIYFLIKVLCLDLIVKKSKRWYLNEGPNLCTLT